MNSSASKSAINPWSRSSASRFSGYGSMHPQAYEKERESRLSVGGKADGSPATPKRPSAFAAGGGGTTTPKRTATPKRRASPPGSGESPGAPSESRPRAASTGKKGSSAFASSSKGRFDAGHGSMYALPSAASPGPGAFDHSQSSIGFCSSGPSVAKPSPGMAVTSKGRFDGPGSMYRAPSPRAKKGKKVKKKTAEEESREQWSEVRAPPPPPPRPHRPHSPRSTAT